MNIVSVKTLYLKALGLAVLVSVMAMSSEPVMASGGSWGGSSHGYASSGGWNTGSRGGLLLSGRQPVRNLIARQPVRNLWDASRVESEMAFPTSGLEFATDLVVTTAQVDLQGDQQVTAAAAAMVAVAAMAVQEDTPCRLAVLPTFLPRFIHNLL